MTLKEKFIPLVWFNYKSFNVYQNKEKDKNSNKCVEIADDYAIEFSNWVDNLKPSQIVSVWSKDGAYSGMFNMDKEQLLKQFKKEKGL